MKNLRKVKTFGKVKLCKVEVYHEKDPDHVYSGIKEVLWIERGEDEYARHHYENGKTPCVIIYRNDWLRGKDVTQDD